MFYLRNMTLLKSKNWNRETFLLQNESRTKNTIYCKDKEDYYLVLYIYILWKISCNFHTNDPRNFDDTITKRSSLTSSRSNIWEFTTIHFQWFTFWWVRVLGIFLLLITWQELFWGQFLWKSEPITTPSKHK